MQTTCPVCGAALAEGLACRQLFDRGQALEIEQPERYAVHHLSVPCYRLHAAAQQLLGARLA